jgi:hypothetical protein
MKKNPVWSYDTKSCRYKCINTYCNINCCFEHLVFKSLLTSDCSLNYLVAEVTENYYIYRYLCMNRTKLFLTGWHINHLFQ